uniref:Uncharacterized protein n=1 Tax=Romanomermis culicivorax TaxID=13658 RepID=A0A915HI99_ROMCU
MKSKKYIGKFFKAGFMLNDVSAQCLHDIEDLASGVVEAGKPVEFNFGFQRSGIQLLIQSKYSYVLSAPIHK